MEWMHGWPECTGWIHSDWMGRVQGGTQGHPGWMDRVQGGTQGQLGCFMQGMQTPRVYGKGTRTQSLHGMDTQTQRVQGADRRMDGRPVRTRWPEAWLSAGSF